MSNMQQTESQEFSPVKTLKDFQREIDQLAFEKRIDFMEAVLLYCELTGMEIEVAGSLIKSSAKMKARIQDEAEALNFFPKTTKLPI
jgi:hypothetical protein